jgi:signal peptidase II
VDFVGLHAFGYHWYVFNVADTAITLGVILLLYDSFVADRRSVSAA